MSVISPTGLLGVRSPIFFTWNGSSRDQLDRMRLEIYAWTGDKDVRPSDPVYTIDRSTGFVDFYPTADIAPLIENLFNQKTTNLDTDTFTTLSSDSLLWIEVDYILDWTNTESSPLGTGQDTGTTTRFLVTDGYSDFTDRANKDIGQAILIEATDLSLIHI